MLGTYKNSFKNLKKKDNWFRKSFLVVTFDNEKKTTRLGKGSKMCFQLSIASSMEEIFNVIHLRVAILSGLLAKELIPAFEKWKK